MDLLSSRSYVARKKHRCNYCGGFIEIGEKYERQAIKGDDFYMWKSHIKCQLIAFRLDMFGKCDDGVTLDAFHEFISEEYLHLKEYKTESDFPEFKERLAFVCNHYAAPGPDTCSCEIPYFPTGNIKFCSKCEKPTVY